MRKMLLFSLFALVIPLRAASPPIGAVVVSWDIDSTKNMVTLHMVNNTTKDITFYNVSIRETYTNGGINEHQYSQETPDVSSLFNDPTYPHHESLREHYHGGNGTWQAGTTRDIKIPVAPNLATFEAAIDAITYLDNTAEGSNADALTREGDANKAAAQMLRATNEVIRKALANASDKFPHETAAKEIEGRGHDGTSVRIAKDLREAPAIAAQLNKPLHDYLEAMIARNEKLASSYLSSATPKTGGTQ